MAVIKVFVAVPPVAPKPYDPPAPTAKLLVIFGKLNVVDPSPAPKVIPITLNNPEYTVLDTAAPLHSTQPDGAVDVGHIYIEPTGI